MYLYLYRYIYLYYIYISTTFCDAIEALAFESCTKITFAEKKAKQILSEVIPPL